MKESGVLYGLTELKGQGNLFNARKSHSLKFQSNTNVYFQSISCGPGSLNMLQTTSSFLRFVNL